MAKATIWDRPRTVEALQGICIACCLAYARDRLRAWEDLIAEDDFTDRANLADITWLIEGALDRIAAGADFDWMPPATCCGPQLAYLRKYDDFGEL